LTGFTRLSGLTVPGSRYFFKVSSTPDFDNKILSTVESGFEAQNLLKFCPEYCSKPKWTINRSRRCWLSARRFAQGDRFTISEAARREVLDRLLELNHQRYAEEVAQGLHDKGKKRSKATEKKSKITTNPKQGELFYSATLLKNLTHY